MKVLITGGFGFIGKRFIKKFSDNYEISVFGIDGLNINKNDSIFRKLNKELGSIIEKKFQDFVGKTNPDVIIHLAALTGRKKNVMNSQKTLFQLMCMVLIML